MCEFPPLETVVLCDLYLKRWDTLACKGPEDDSVCPQSSTPYAADPLCFVRNQIIVLQFIYEGLFLLPTPRSKRISFFALHKDLRLIICVDMLASQYVTAGSASMSCGDQHLLNVRGNSYTRSLTDGSKSAGGLTSADKLVRHFVPISRRR